MLKFIIQKIETVEYEDHDHIVSHGFHGIFTGTYDQVKNYVAELNHNKSLEKENHNIRVNDYYMGQTKLHNFTRSLPTERSIFKKINSLDKKIQEQIEQVQKLPITVEQRNEIFERLNSSNNKLHTELTFLKNIRDMGVDVYNEKKIEQFKLENNITDNAPRSYTNFIYTYTKVEEIN